MDDKDAADFWLDEFRAGNVTAEAALCSLAGQYHSIARLFRQNVLLLEDAEKRANKWMQRALDKVGEVVLRGGVGVVLAAAMGVCLLAVGVCLLCVPMAILTGNCKLTVKDGQGNKKE